ncbi:DUF3152 domain-containing protein [Kribbella sancticallisti]|uniref:DUF3152 domain-containing protein n=1 Tax=Kribbella sancticallisti TaxID=460087 RepID=A0ABP4NSI8_9ACTN
MRRLRVVGLGLAAAALVGALVQLPASPFEQGYPQRPVAQTSTDSTTGESAKNNPAEPRVQSTPAASNAAPGRPAPQITYPVRGTGGYSVLPGDPATIGTGGKLFTFQIAIEGGIRGVDRAAFARFVRDTYSAPQGWASGGLYRFRQVGPGQPADFKLMLVTPATRDSVCGGGFDQYTSCRIGDRVVLNVARWVQGVPNYGAPLAAYRQYMINHETGHRLGRGHELCPGPGQPAPVMEQQTLGLHGCTAYSWPYLNGERYKGRLGQYNDSLPTN